MPQNAPAPRPNLQVAARVEELLREQLEELGVNPRTLAPEDIAANMHCHLAPNGSMTYLWKNEPMLYVTPETLVDSVINDVYKKRGQLIDAMEREVSSDGVANVMALIRLYAK